MSKFVYFLKFIFHTSVILLIILSLYPGSLMGLLLYQDLTKQPDLIENPFGTSINHFISYFYVSLLGFCLYLRNESFHRLVYGLFALSIILETLQFIIPIRTFQFYDLLGNILGVLLAFFLVKIYLHFNKP